MSVFVPAPHFSAVVLDVDSTIAGVEGIDWLARRRGNDVASAVAELTRASMEGEVPLEDVYGSRLALVRPSREDLEALTAAYAAALAPGARAAIARLRACGVRVVLVSGGLRAAVLPLGRQLGIASGDVLAVELVHDDAGEYVDFDHRSPLTTATGKLEVVRSLKLPAPILFVGDGATDLAAR